MNLLDEIRSDLVNESASVANTLRKAKILASEIGLPEFREWVEFELNGYPDQKSVPEYRQFQATNLGTLSGPFGSLDKNVPVPTFNLPERIKNSVENLIFFEGVGELEAQALRAPLYKKWRPEYLIIAREYMGWSGGMELVDVQQPIPAHVILGILEQVKNRLLSFVLGLQESNITSENLEDRTVAPEIARNTFNTYIVGDQNTVASGENVNQTIKTVAKGDLESLLNFLREIRINEGDVSKLADAVSAEPDATNGRIGPKVQNWLGEMMYKMTSGALTVGKNTTAIMLAQAINSYYGINPPV